MELKRMLVASMAATFSFGLVACGNNADGDDDNNTSAMNNGFFVRFGDPLGARGSDVRGNGPS